MQKKHKIQKMFNSLYFEYDFLNNLISFGLHKKVKKKAIELLLEKNIKKGLICADFCCGSADLACILSKSREVKKVFGIDFSEKMLKIAKKRVGSKSKIELIQTDVSCLPFENCFFDCAIIGFGIRNVENLEKTVFEIQRVLKKGSKFVVLEFISGKSPMKSIFNIFILFFAFLFSKNFKAYKYLIGSKTGFLSPKKLERKFKCANLVLKKQKKLCLNNILIQVYEKQ